MSDQEKRPIGRSGYEPPTDTTPISPSSGTSTMPATSPGALELLVSVDMVTLHNGQLVIHGVPPTGADADQPHPDVIASLERSLKEHADVWAELSRY